MDIKKYSPMIQHYLKMKEENPEALLFYRLGDFYEMFFDDAKTASQELDLVLTAKAAGSNEKVPMCGIPYHAADSYIQRLIKKGYKVAICEQLSDPAASKGLVERDIIRIVTPGTYMSAGLEAKSYNYLAAVMINAWNCALVLCELSTGDLKGTLTQRNPAALLSMLMEFQVMEVLVDEKLDARWTGPMEEAGLLVSRSRKAVLEAEDEKLAAIDHPLLKSTLALLMNYLKTTQRQSIDHLMPMEPVEKNNILVMDYETRSHLELTRTNSSALKAQTLFSLIDKTRSAIGSRMLKNWIEQPLADKNQIYKRQNSVSQLVKDFLLREELQEHLEGIYDLERLTSRIAFGTASPKDVLQLIYSLKEASILASMLKSIHHQEDFQQVDALGDLYEIIKDSINENPPATLKDGGVIARGYNEELDRISQIAEHGKNYILELEAREREKTGIKALKIGYNRVFGYYIEVRNGSLNQIQPEFGYVPKQTLANAQRFVTDELKEREEQVLQAQEKKVSLEQEIFAGITAAIKKELVRLHKLARILAKADALCSLAQAAAEKGWTAPVFNEEHLIDVKEGRHPVLDSKLNHFISNDWFMPSDINIEIITGPNMGGKSTFMRQNALLSVLAQMGSWIPARSASLPVFDRIFTRIGASDDLLKGQSTFMSEMLEANRALKFATKNSLILFDEIGRGTATYDGMALAQAIVEYIDEAIQAKTLFSTHYHELTILAEDRPAVKNIHADVKEHKNQVEFRYRMTEGRADKSYGINVARLANLPAIVISRAQSLLQGLESSQDKPNYQPSLFIMDEVSPEKNILMDRLKHLDIDALSPREALACLYELKSLYDEIESR